jgi:hypothetical protein
MALQENFSPFTWGTADGQLTRARCPRWTFSTGRHVTRMAVITGRSASLRA